MKLLIELTDREATYIHHALVYYSKYINKDTVTDINMLKIIDVKMGYSSEEICFKR